MCGTTKKKEIEHEAAFGCSSGNIILRCSPGTGNRRMGNNIPQRLACVRDLICVAGNHIWIKHLLYVSMLYRKVSVQQEVEEKTQFSGPYRKRYRAAEASASLS